LSILFLAFQLSQNQDTITAQTRHALATASVDLLVGEALNGDLASIVRRSYDNEALSPDERFRLERLLQAYFRSWENIHYQFRAGLYDEEEFNGQREAWRGRLSRPGVADFWCRSRKMHSTSFAREVDALVVPPCDQRALAVTPNGSALPAPPITPDTNRE
jgi:hypothetical protein